MNDISAIAVGALCFLGFCFLTTLVFIAWASRWTAPQRRFVVQALNSTANLARAFFGRG